MIDGVPLVVFLCTANSCRSQMAEGWARALWGGRVLARSAGASPSSVNPLAVRVMGEAGVDVSDHWSKSLAHAADGPIDLLVTVCGGARETCPLVALAGTRVVHHGFDDPPALARREPDEARVLDIYRRVRDEIRAYVAGLPAMLGR